MFRRDEYYEVYDSRSTPTNATTEYGSREAASTIDKLSEEHTLVAWIKRLATLGNPITLTFTKELAFGIGRACTLLTTPEGRTEPIPSLTGKWASTGKWATC